MNLRVSYAAVIMAIFAATYVSAASPEKLDLKLAKVDEKTKVAYYDARELGLEGQGWKETADPYDRFPAKAQKTVRSQVWGLSKNSAGLAVRFVTDATSIYANWDVRNSNLGMPHMPATGVSGVDLYVKADDGQWKWLAIGRPSAVKNNAQLVKGIPEGTREYMLYLPLYNGTTSLEIGVPQGKMLAKAPARPGNKAKPIVFWGTSITQGGCASRPGMVHTAILGRKLDWSVINLGFSGNGKMEPEVASLLAEIDAAVYVIDCLPNCTAHLRKFVFGLFQPRTEFHEPRGSEKSLRRIERVGREGFDLSHGRCFAGRRQRRDCR
jgi:hypothetical protein